jgi:hypothetical protein
MEQKEWYSTRDIAELLGVTITRATQLMHKAIRNNPATKNIRKTPNEKGVLRYEMHRSLYEAELASRPAAQQQVVTSPQPTQGALPLGANPQQDGTIAQVFTEEEYQKFTEALIEWKMLKTQIGQHEAEIERLQSTYEDHIATYESQTNYLRERLHKNEEVTTKLIALMEQRNYIEASNAKTTNQ